jgi:hypothetical protein
MMWWARSWSRADKARSQKSEARRKGEGRRQKAEEKAKAAALPVILRERRGVLAFAASVRATEGSPNAKLALAGAGG